MQAKKVYRVTSNFCRKNGQLRDGEQQQQEATQHSREDREATGLALCPSASSDRSGLQVGCKIRPKRICVKKISCSHLSQLMEN
jgi:hypothetical protein